MTLSRRSWRKAKSRSVGWFFGTWRGKRGVWLVWLSLRQNLQVKMLLNLFKKKRQLTAEALRKGPCSCEPLILLPKMGSYHLLCFKAHAEKRPLSRRHRGSMKCGLTLSCHTPPQSVRPPGACVKMYILFLKATCKRHQGIVGRRNSRNSKNLKGTAR